MGGGISPELRQGDREEAKAAASAAKAPAKALRAWHKKPVVWVVADVAVVGGLAVAGGGGGKVEQAQGEWQPRDRKPAHNPTPCSAESAAAQRFTTMSEHQSPHS